MWLLAQWPHGSLVCSARPSAVHTKRWPPRDCTVTFKKVEDWKRTWGRCHRKCLHKGQRDSSGGSSCNANISCLLRHAIRHQSAAGFGERGALGSHSGLDCSHQLCEAGVANKGQSFHYAREQKGCFIASQSRPALTRNWINTFCSFLFINGAFSWRVLQKLLASIPRQKWGAQKICLTLVEISKTPSNDM